MSGNFNPFEMQYMNCVCIFNCNSMITYVEHYHSLRKLYQHIGYQFTHNHIKKRSGLSGISDFFSTLLITIDWRIHS